LLVAGVRVAIAGGEIWVRQDRHLRGIWGIGLGSTSMLFAGTMVTVFALITQIQPTPWWSPQFALPLFGMILGNTMTGVSLGLDTLHTALYRERAAIEARLLLGSARWEAVSAVQRQAVRSGFTPIINCMKTGQILSGVDPQEAVKYQILITLLIGGATGLGVLAATFASVWRLTDSRDRLRLDRLAAART
jgi:putative ABC transport system permease protein